MQQYQKRRNNNGFVALRAVVAACYAMMNVQSFSIVVRQVEQTTRHHQHNNLQSHFSSLNNKPTLRSFNTIRHMAGDDNENVTDKSSDTSEVEIVSESEVVEITESTENENIDDEETKQLQEDIEAETKMIKQEINQFEMDLKGKRRTLDYYNDLADEYTKAGYARKVAEMENMRRTRSSLASSNKFTATASTLTEFLPIVDSVETLREKYGEDSFGKQYNAVSGSVKSALSELGVTPFEIKAGDVIDDPRKIDVIESQYSTEYPKKGSVIKVISNGMELKGNIVRPAKCIVSLGAAEQQVESKEEVSDNIDAEAVVEAESAAKAES